MVNLYVGECLSPWSIADEQGTSCSLMCDFMSEVDLECLCLTLDSSLIGISF